MTKVVNCPCGETIRAEEDDELVAKVEEHVVQQHPDMVAMMTRNEILAMAAVE